MIKDGDKLNISFTLKYENNIVGKNSNLEICMGDPENMVGVEKYIRNLYKDNPKYVGGKEENFIIPPQDAYGNIDKKLLIATPKEMLGEVHQIKIGKDVELFFDDKKLEGRIVKESDHHVIVDCNHPLSGKEIEITLVILS